MGDDPHQHADGHRENKGGASRVHRVALPIFVMAGQD
jgi:hypothetical protein